MEQASVVPEWAELVGAKIAEVTTPREVRRDGVLVVAVKSAAWMQELQMMEPQIRNQLWKRGKKIKRIVWRAE
jgi:predicted nucleic acid-binding Zn ribbon protein